VSMLHLIQAKGAGQGLKYLDRDIGLASLLQAAVVVRAQPGQHCQFLLAQAGDPAWPGEGPDAGLGRAQPVAPRTQKGTERSAICWHTVMIRRLRCGRVVLL
jgi:hypothetical protein